MLPCKLCLPQGADKVSDIGLVAAWRKIKQYCIVQDHSIISAYTSSHCDRYLNLFLFQVLADYVPDTQEGGKNIKPLYLTILAPERNFPEVNSVPSKEPSMAAIRFSSELCLQTEAISCCIDCLRLIARSHTHTIGSQGLGRSCTVGEHHSKVMMNLRRGGFL